MNGGEGVRHGTSAGKPDEGGKLVYGLGRVTRKLGKLPTIFEYEQKSVYSAKPLVSRFKGWRLESTQGWCNVRHFLRR
jgi:hypothetical protein